MGALEDATELGCDGAPQCDEDAILKGAPR
jgi:hypothetical protein